MTKIRDAKLTIPAAAGWSALAIASFHLAYGIPFFSFTILLYLVCLYKLSRLNSGRKAFYFGLATGLAIYAPQLNFFWTIFGGAAIALWLVLAFWIGLFVLIAHLTYRHLGIVWAACLAPFQWTALEYFRSELYYLRFSWLNVGYAFQQGLEHIGWLGVYGIGFVLMAAVAMASLLASKRATLLTSSLFAGLFAVGNMPMTSSPSQTPESQLNVAGVQLEFPSDAEVLKALNSLIKKHPDTDIFMLSEYTFLEPVPETIKDWCRTHRRHLVVGATDPVGDTNYYNTAFVIGPEGTIVFKQAKSVPIQFFKDGLPAASQEVWDSPWGKLGLGVCYDMSYRRVMDRLIQKGAQALLLPTMDVIEWGRHQHELHGRIGPVRAAEYRIPIFRVCSSGISQIISANGHVEASSPFPGEGETITGTLLLPSKGRLPWDCWITPAAIGVTSISLLAMGAVHWRKKPSKLS